jgi:hypothetical protein
MIEHSANRATRFWWDTPRGWPVMAAVAMLPLLGACSGASAPPATPVVLVATATPPPATSAPVGTATAPPAGTPVARSARAAATPTSAPAEQRLAVNRTNAYRGLEVTVDEVRSGATIENQRAPRGKTLVGVRLRLHNPSGQPISSQGQQLTDAIRLQVPTGANPRAEPQEPFRYLNSPPGETITGWLYFELDPPVLLEPLKLALGGGNETPVVIPFTGPEEKVAPRSFEYLRSTDGEVRGLLWSVSGGTIRLDIPGQQANPGQEFMILKLRATNPGLREVGWLDDRHRGRPAKEYLRLEADNGVLLQVSAELNALPEDFPPRAEQDALYAWQLPKGSRNPTLVILSPDGSEARLPVGPLPLS